ncbi:hypothetical protein [Goodfellowiella coeruleoviolacea]|uniref:Uncharacterized protein n=1 Tax=Goodfellowiella coeruleoviolacea TaxID=334858 RepID=A0AAE3GF00_9PSEU|nr:hypothetical protein [Goodfellowiella coeruleoviolacea]MCP2167051.1 hypothetical protein [Goodfellowiella coeruleoviolacea]
MTTSTSRRFLWWRTVDGTCHAFTADQAGGTDDGLCETACDHVVAEQDLVRAAGPKLCGHCLIVVGAGMPDEARWRG